MWKFICKISSHHDKAEILLKLALSTNQSINQSIWKGPKRGKLSKYFLLKKGPANRNGYNVCFAAWLWCLDLDLYKWRFQGNIGSQFWGFNIYHRLNWAKFKIHASFFFWTSNRNEIIDGYGSSLWCDNSSLHK